MKTLDGYIGRFLMILLLVTAACSTTGSAGRTQGSGNSGITVDDPSLTLADYLRRVPGVSVQGSGDNAKVLVRGSQSVRGTNEPLFVINGQRVGRSYSNVSSMVEVSDIESIRVLKGSQASSAYGMDGSNGVIEITTKSN